MKSFYNAIVIGASTGGLKVLETILSRLPNGYFIPIMIVQHRAKEADDYMCRHLEKFCTLTIKEAEDKEVIQPGYVYIAPGDYHLLVEMDKTLSLSMEPSVNYSRPSVDVLFETAAEAYREKLVGVVLTGANQDGSMGLKKIKDFNGLAVVQQPDTAEASRMPLEAIATVESIDYILTVEEIAMFISKLGSWKK